MATGEEKWEYCRLEHPLETGFIAAKLVFFTSEGEKLESLQAEGESTQRNVVAKRIAELGEQGWEMITTGITGQGSHGVYFKRRKN